MNEWISKGSTLELFFFDESGLAYFPADDTKDNPANSRSLSKSDSILSRNCLDVVEIEFGGSSGYNLDLSLDSNVQRNSASPFHTLPYT